MAIVSDLVIYFLYALALGTMAFSSIVPLKLTGAGLCRVLAGVSLGSILLGMISIFVTKEIMATPLVIGSLGVVLFYAWEIFNLKDEKKNLYWIFYGLTMITLLLVIRSLFSLDLYNFLYFALNALFLGSLSYAMILGHWYLVTPKISEQPLLIAIKFFWLFLILKLAVAVGSYLVDSGVFETGPWVLDSMFNWIVFSMRFLWGYLALIVLSVFAWKLTKMRSIQSSTGVLYVMVFFIFVGEVASLYLYYKFGVFL